MHQWHVYSEFKQASAEAAEALAVKIASCLDVKDICHVVLPGGSTPVDCLQQLAKKNLAWGKIHWYLSDERCYPTGHHERNDVMLQENFWSHLPDAIIHSIPAELGPEVAASLYREVIRPVKNFDIAFLGMGEDGHTASLFPDNKVLHDKRTVVPVFDSPKAPDQRVSLGMTSLKNAEYRMVLAAGKSKAEIIARIKKVRHCRSIAWAIFTGILMKRLHLYHNFYL